MNIMKNHKQKMFWSERFALKGLFVCLLFSYLKALDRQKSNIFKTMRNAPHSTIAISRNCHAMLE